MLIAQYPVIRQGLGVAVGQRHRTTDAQANKMPTSGKRNSDDSPFDAGDPSA